MVLRKCLVLAHVLKNDRLKSWAQSELNGYEPDAELPGYRKSAAGAKGNFMGPFGSALNNFVIPPQLLDEDDRHHAQYALLNQAVAAYEDLLRLSAVKGTLTLHWSNAMIGYYMDRLPMSGGLQLVDAWQEIPRSAFTQLLDTVRNRALSLALELKDEVGDDDTALKQLSQTSIEKVSSGPSCMLKSNRRSNWAWMEVAESDALLVCRRWCSFCNLYARPRPKLRLRPRVSEVLYEKPFRSFPAIGCFDSESSLGDPERSHARSKGPVHCRRLYRS